MKSILFIIAILFITSCGKKKDESCTSMLCEVFLYSLQTTDTGPVPEEAKNFSVQLKLVNFSPSQELKILEAARLVEKVLRSKQFKDAVVEHRFNQENAFANNHGLTNLQIYDRVIIAAEQKTPAKNFQLDAEIELYYENTNTIGYTYPGTKRIWMNSKYFDQMATYGVAGNLTHEWLHKLGFTHDEAATDTRPYSVPYAIGQIMRNLASKEY